MGVGEANKARHSHATRPCEPTRPRNTNVYTMSSSKRKKTVVPASKKRNGASSSAGPTAKIRHPLLQFPRRPQKELFQIPRAQPLNAGHCIGWAAREQVQMADAIRALLTTDPWELFFKIIELTYLELTMEPCSMFHLQTIMTRYDNPSTGGERALSSSTPTTSTSYGACRKGTSLTLPILSPLRFRIRQSDIERGVISIGPYVTRLHRLAQFTNEEAYDDILDDVPPQYEDPPTQPPPPSRPVHTATSYADISERLTRFE
ncbi:hypothetical protein GOBAR_AA25831 [Gossypium barbadense]|uniref:Uncharacterized protein n=1 Tax=Gossypium barbadense TaxID=3634 RepID=A0A2P5WUR1_GOSBA|nr:hypothetical protein GOBAR_AA25831 [Gossypium barbadense]